ncbi:MAG TPA: PAS domain S-box protein [Patescibacteria group bacterium]|nr:PAS domain S-box protein [Patescibacteria group bacterium]
MHIDDDTRHTEGAATRKEKKNGSHPGSEGNAQSGSPGMLGSAHEVYRICHGALLRAKSETGLLEEICRFIVEKGGYRSVWVGYSEREGARAIRPVAQAGYKSGDLETLLDTWADGPLGSGPAETAVRTTEPVIYGSLLADSRHESWRDDAAARGYSSMIALPLVAVGETIGAVSIYAAQPGIFDESQVMLLAKTARDIAQGILSLRARFECEHIKETLIKSEEIFKKFFNSANDAIFVLDYEGYFLELNETACLRLGYTREELLHMTPQEIDTPEFAQTVSSRIDEIRRRGQTVFETAHVTKDGAVIPIELNARMIEFEGKPAILSIARDITERKRAEQALRESEEKYSKLFHQSNDAIFIHDLEGNIIDVNQRVIDYLGYGRDEILALNVRNLHPPEALERSKEALESVAREGHTSFEIDFRKKNGEIFPAEISASRFEIGERKVIQGIARDLTDRRVAEKALRESQELYETLVHTSPEAITTADLAGNITYVSPNTLVLHGYERAEELLGKNALELIAPEEHDRAVKNIQRTLKSGSVRDVEYTLVRKDGSRFTGELNAALVKDGSGKPIFFIATIRDVTGRKRMEEQLRQSQKMEALGALAGGIAHDFNNLLIPVIGYTDLLALKLKDHDPLLMRYIDEIKKTAERATTLTKQLLTLGRRQMLKMIVLDLNALVSNLEDLLRRLMGEDIEFSLNLEQGLMPVTADPNQIELIIINLVVNACDAMPGGGTLTIQTENVSISRKTADTLQEIEPGDYVRLTVKDTGVGMDGLTRERIFEPFFTTKEAGQGTGLGLATVYGSVKQHDGWIDIHSKRGKGSSFMIYFPASLRIVKDRVERERQTYNIRGNNERILLVEDDSAVRELTADILSNNGYTILEARNGAEALEIAAREERKIDVVFSDVVLPGRSGIQLIEELLSRDPDLKVILSSGYAAPKSQWDLIQEKGYRFIQKPYKMVDLLKAIKEVCDSS